jgi:hypothetical protein
LENKPTYLNVILEEITKRGEEQTWKMKCKRKR